MKLLLITLSFLICLTTNAQKTSTYCGYPHWTKTPKEAVQQVCSYSPLIIEGTFIKKTDAFKSEYGATVIYYYNVTNTIKGISTTDTLLILRREGMIDLGGGVWGGPSGDGANDAHLATKANSILFLKPIACKQYNNKTYELVDQVAYSSANNGIYNS